MIVNVATFRNWAIMSKLRQEGCVLRISNPAFFFKEFTGTGPEDGEKFRQLKDAVEKKLVKSKWSLTFVVKYEEDASPRPRWSVSVKGQILEVLQEILYNGNAEENLKLVAKEVGTFREEEEIGLKIERVAAEMQPFEEVVSKHFCYFQNDIYVPQLDEALSQDIEWGLSLQLVLEK